MEQNILINSINKQGDLQAIMEDDGVSCWLYLLNANNEIIADTWVYNRIPSPSKSELVNYEGTPPPAITDYCNENAFLEKPFEHQWTLKWSKNDLSIQILRDDMPHAFILHEMKQGYSKGLIKHGPWGFIWQDEVYLSHF